MVVTFKVVGKERRERRERLEIECLEQFVRAPWEVSSEEVISLEITDGELVTRIERVVKELDLSGLLQSYSGRGSPAYPPAKLLMVVLYEIQKGRCLPTQWHEDLKSNVIVQWIARGLRPSRATLYRFRERLAPWIDDWNAQVLGWAIEEGHTQAKRVALDGTTLAAYASRHRVVSHKVLSRRLAALEACCVADQLNLSIGRTPRWMAQSLAGRRLQRERYQRASQRMQELQLCNQRRRSDKRRPPERIQVSASDPDAALGYDKLGTFRPLYNVQVIGDVDSPFVLAYEVLPQVSEAKMAEPMLERMLQLTGCKPEQLLADSAYATPQDLAVYDAAGVELFASFQENSYTEQKKSKRAAMLQKNQFRWLPEQQAYVCPQGHPLRFEQKTSKQSSSGEQVRLEIYRCAPEHCMTCPLQTLCTSVPAKGRTVRRHAQQDLIDSLGQRMVSAESQRLYRRFRPTIERVFADVKEHRNLRRLNGRGLRHAKIQVGLTILAHNMVTLEKVRSETAEKVAA
jgi:transposase